MKKLYIPLPDCLRFQKLYDNSRYSEFLQLILENDPTQISIFYLTETDKDVMLELRRILISSKIRYTLKED